MNEVFQNADSRYALLERVSRAIDEGVLGMGIRLPTEREISAISGLSRSAVRTMLLELEQSGRIVREVGRGTFVSHGKADPIASSEMRLSPAEIIEMRSALEPNLAALVVSKATSADIEQMQKILQEGTRVKTWSDAERCDAEFHDLFYRAAHNRGIDHMADFVRTVRRQEVWLNLKRSMFSATRWTTYQSEHENILEYVRSRDAHGLKQAVFSHLTNVQNRMI